MIPIIPTSLRQYVEYVPRTVDFLRSSPDRSDAPGVAAGLSNDQFNWRPGPNRWSIAECLGNVNVASKLFMPTFDEAIATGRQRGLTATGPFAYPMLQRYFVRLGNPPPAIRVRTPGAFPNFWW